MDAVKQATAEARAELNTLRAVLVARESVEHTKDKRIAELEADNARLRYELETVRLWAKGHYMQVSDLVTGATEQQKKDEGK